MFRVTALLMAMLVFISCGSTNKNMSASEFLPRKGYIFVKKTINLKKCLISEETGEPQCMEGEFISVGSGFVVDVAYGGSYVMTAAHVCMQDRNDLLPEVEMSVALQAETLDGRTFEAKTLDYNREMDICMMFVKDLFSDIQKVEIAESAPKEGDKVFNIASPYGIHYPNVVPIFEGRYIGKRGHKSFYTFEAAPGSSGSMILNSEGKLIGLLHSVHRRLYTVVVSANYGDLKGFITKVITMHQRLLQPTSTYEW